jgi:DNA-binding PadR family transcriptional regulator
MILSTLDALLLFLAGHKGMSGYDIRRLFQATPLGVYSDSPGAIYPALARLERRKLLSSSAEKSGRRRRAFQRTTAGETALRAWIAAPLERDVLTRRAEELDIRFVITGEFMSWSEAKQFAARCAHLYAADIERLEHSRAEHAGEMGRASLAALELGVRNFKTRLKWCRDVVTEKGLGK